MISAAAALSNEEIVDRLDRLFREKAAVEGAIVVLLGEVERRQTYRQDGATSSEAWAVERFGVSTPTARAYSHLAEKAWDIPHLVAGLCDGDLSLDKVRAVADTATPETDRDLREQAGKCTVRQLSELARSKAEPSRTSESSHERRFLRFNDQFRTMTVQLPTESYAETRACLHARARQIPSDGETPWDQRLCDAFMGMVRSSGRRTTSTSSPYFVVAHVPLAALVDESGETTELAGELERDGLISGETVRRIACDATIAIGVDDDVGPHDVRGPGPARTDRRPAPGGHAPGPPLPVPRVHERDVHQHTPCGALETRREHGPLQPRAPVPPPPSPRP